MWTVPLLPPSMVWQREPLVQVEVVAEMEENVQLLLHCLKINVSELTPTVGALDKETLIVLIMDSAALTDVLTDVWMDQSNKQQIRPKLW
jgi:hypothetical protein